MDIPQKDICHQSAFRQKPHPMSKPSFQLQEIPVSPDHPVAKQLVDLYNEFVKLDTNIKIALIELTGRGTLEPIQIAMYIVSYFRREGLTLTDAIDIHKLFEALWPHYNYLDIEVLEVIVENEDFQITKFQDKILTYKQHLKEFKTSTTLNEFKDAVEIALIPTPETNEITCEVVIKLVDEWRKQKIEIFKLLIKYMFNHRMSHIHVKEGSLFVTLLIARSKLEYVLKYANIKKEFASLVGIFELSINGKLILKEEEKTNFSFVQALHEASKISNVEAIQFLKFVINYDSHSCDNPEMLLDPITPGDQTQVKESMNLQDVPIPLPKLEIIKISSAENEQIIKTGLDSLSNSFDILMEAVTSALERKLQNQQIVLVDLTKWIEYRMNWVGELTDVKDLNELLEKINLHFDFLDCGLIVDMSEEFLNNECFGKDKKNLVSELKKHTEKAEILCHSSTVKNLKDCLNSIYYPHREKLSDMPLSDMPLIRISLHNPWNEATVDKLYLLIKHLLPDEFKQSIPKTIQIFPGSVIIELLVVKLNVKRLISYLQDKLQFMRLIGIFRLTINGESILVDDEIMNFTFESALGAANVGHIEAVQFLLKLGGNVNHVNKEGATALMIAANRGHKQVVQLLLNEHANINHQGKDGWTALMVASQNGHYEVTQLLLKEHADINHQGNDGVTALMLASQNGYHQVVQLLLEEHTNIDTQKEDGQTALMVASGNGHYEVTELLLKEHADINHQGKDGWTALMLASENGHHQVVELLLKEHADINHQGNNGVTALMLASQNGYHQAVQLLLEEHTNIDTQKEDGQTALMVASGNGHYEVTELLLKEHANINHQGKDGWTALMLASENGHFQVVELLLKEHADINHQGNDGVTALMLASQNGYHQVVELLLKEHTNINTQKEDGSTALMLASKNGHSQVVELLLKKNADVFIHNKEECTALSLASDNGHVQVVELLLKEKEDIDIHQQKGGVIPVIIGSQNKESQVIEPKDKEKSDVKTPVEDKNIAVMLDPEHRNTQQHLTRLISST